MVLRTILFILLMTKNLQTNASGFDAYSSCYRTSRKRQDLPCDFGSQTWCTIPGNSYPWHAVRRFVHENQGLMRRMYGDERHISVLRAELESNDIEYFSSPSIKEEFRRRYSKDTDRSKDFVKMFMNSEGRKLFNDPKQSKTTKVQKIQKSIEEKSNNVLYQNHIKNTKDEDSKSPSGNALSNKTLHKTTTTAPPTTKPSIIESATFTTTNTEATVNQTTTEPPSSVPTSITSIPDSTIQPTTRAEALQNNLTKPSGNDTFDEEYDYGSETEEMPTTTSLDSLTTTEFEEEALKDKEDYEEAAEGVEAQEQDTTDEQVSPEPSPLIRLKGINACPVKEEVVAPFWANNTRGEVLALLNLYPFEQYVHWEKCTYEHKQMFCREGCRCEQQYRLHRLLAYDPNNECRGIFSDWFRFPSCCVCKCYDLPMEFRLTSRRSNKSRSAVMFDARTRNPFWGTAILFGFGVAVMLNEFPQARDVTEGAVVLPAAVSVGTFSFVQSKYGDRPEYKPTLRK